MITVTDVNKTNEKMITVPHNKILENILENKIRIC